MAEFFLLNSFCTALTSLANILAFTTFSAEERGQERGKDPYP
jgi:hypothetical protein